MSTRWYPLYQKGNPQLRVFLPNFWMKLVEPSTKHPPNVLQFHVSLQMTRHDVKNYLEKIYNIHPVEVRTRIQTGKIWKRPQEQYIIKEADYKVAYAVLPKDLVFFFPNLFNKDEKEKEDQFEKDSFEAMKKDHRKYLSKNNKPGVPGWFSI